MPRKVNIPKVLPITKEEIKELILKRGLQMTDVIDCVVELNGYVGVGLITLADGVSEYIYDKIRRG